MRLQSMVLTLGMALIVASTASAQDAATGKALFGGRCGACHQVASDKSGPLAPSLKGIVGRNIAAQPDFTYSAALKAHPGHWTAVELDTYLASPLKFAPGTKMFMAVTNPADRANIIAYLKTAK